MNAEGFRTLHRPGQPLFLPNAWDLASARWLAHAGHPVVGTTSLGVAYGSGLPDGTGAGVARTTALARVLTGAGIPVTVDLEAGSSDDPGEVAEEVRGLAALGVVGVNLEDSRAGQLLDARLAAAKVAAAAAVPGIFVNARTDVFWLRAGDPRERTAEALRRSARYAAAGADGVFVPGVADLATTARLVAGVDVPFNALLSPAGPGTTELAGCGVARTSCGSLLFRAALQAAVDTAATLGRGGTVPPPPPYEEFA